MRPETAQDLYLTLFKTMIIRAYGDITTAARRKRLTEHDIRSIEKNVLTILAESQDFSGEFPAFDAKRVIVMTLDEVDEWFTACRAERIKKIAEES